MKENINNASYNAIEDIKTSYALQDIAVNSKYKLSELKEAFRVVECLDKVKQIVSIADDSNIELHVATRMFNSKPKCSITEELINDLHKENKLLKDTITKMENSIEYEKVEAYKRGCMSISITNI